MEREAYENSLDAHDRNILGVLRDNARISLKNLAERVGMSSPAVSERLHRLEERGILTAFSIEIDPAALGYTLQALVRVRPLPGHHQEVKKWILALPECTECDKVTGEDCYVLRVHARSLTHLDELIEDLEDHAQTHTSIVKSQLIKRRLPPF